MSKLIRQDLQSPDREASIRRRRAILQNQQSPEDISDESMMAFLLEQEIQPTVGHEPRQVVKVRLR